MTALLLIDLQNDFCPGGALAVAGGHHLASMANRLMADYPLVVASMDWHPVRHVSFAAMHDKRPGEVVRHDGLEQVLWPVHCVQGSHGARLLPDLDQAGIHQLVCKGTDPSIDSYSAFFDNAKKRSTGLSDFLREKGITDLSVMGLALDYCVKFSVLDALEEGFSVTLLRDGCRAVNLVEGDDELAVSEMRSAGARVV